MPTSTLTFGGKYPCRTDVNFFPSREHNVSIESFFRTARHQTGALSERSAIVDQSEKSRVKTTLAWRLPSKNSVPHFIQFSASSRTIRPAWSYKAAYYATKKRYQIKPRVIDRKRHTIRVELSKDTQRRYQSVQLRFRPGMPGGGIRLNLALRCRSPSR